MNTYIASADRSKVTEVVLGRGDVLVAHTTDFDGLPGIVFTPSPQRGVPGTEFAPKEKLEIGTGSVVLAFSNMDAVLAHLDRVKALMEAWQAKVSPS